ncbi:hypothetical protein [Dokdonella sp.]|uniref:hypothetical protein n=1 Tax=Dokdonella sp. TaxID=2291710 RepID=UPI0025BA5483|nr:hypothetical protein [Dokdonella sp.]MBX3687948.1 hypothetical protein [Dokdonella sp.]
MVSNFSLLFFWGLWFLALLAAGVFVLVLFWRLVRAQERSAAAQEAIARNSAKGGER